MISGKAMRKWHAVKHSSSPAAVDTRTTDADHSEDLSPVAGGQEDRRAGEMHRSRVKTIIAQPFREAPPTDLVPHSVCHTASGFRFLMSDDERGNRGGSRVTRATRGKPEEGHGYFGQGKEPKLKLSLHAPFVARPRIGQARRQRGAPAIFGTGMFRSTLRGT